MKRMCSKELLTGGMLALVACFMLFIFAPCTLYILNQDDFWFDIYMLLPVVTVTFLLMLCINLLIFLFIYKLNIKLYNWILTLYVIGFISTYIQGNYLVHDLPILDGAAVNWSDYSFGHIKTIIVWFMVSVVTVAIYRKAGDKRFKKLIRVMSGFMLMVLGVTLISILIINSGYRKKDNRYVATDKGMLEMSQDKNFIIFLLDAVDGETVNEIFDSESDYKKIFDDFTFFRNTLGGYPATQIAVPFIISGEWYEGKEPFDTYWTDAYSNSILFSNMEKDGYKLSLYEWELPKYGVDFKRFGNVSANATLGSYYKFSKFIIQIAAYQYAPFILKPYCYGDITYADSLRGVNEEGCSAFSFYGSDSVFHDYLQKEPVTYIKEPCFKWFHLEGAHEPFRYDDNLEIIENGTYDQSVKASLVLTNEYLQKLKESGVYDNSVIIVMADHGYSEDRDAKKRMNPILFVKGMEEKHTLQISDAPISYIDLQEAFHRLQSGCDSSAIFDYREGDRRVRRCLVYKWEKEKDVYEYTVDGHVYDRNAMKAVEEEMD